MQLGDLFVKLAQGKRLSQYELELLRQEGNRIDNISGLVAGWSSPSGYLQTSMAIIGKTLLDMSGISTNTDTSSNSFTAASSDRVINGETIGAGDVLIGDNTSGRPNILWDQSAGILYFRLGTVVQNFMSSTAVAAVGAKVFRENNQTIPNTGIHYIEWENEAYDDSGFVDLGGDDTKITIPTGLAGRYQIVSAAAIEANGTGYRILLLHINGTAYHSNFQMGSASHSATLQIVDEVELDAGDYIQMGLYQNSGADRLLSGSPLVQENPFCLVRKVR